MFDPVTVDRRARQKMLKQVLTDDFRLKCSTNCVRELFLLFPRLFGFLHGCVFRLFGQFTVHACDYFQGKNLFSDFSRK